MAEQKRLLIDYFKKNIKKGYDSDNLKWTLISQGYSRTIVEIALEEAKKEMQAELEATKKPQIKYEVIDENNKPVMFKKPWWKRLLGL
jgi:hypothetical protein